MNNKIRRAVSTTVVIAPWLCILAFFVAQVLEFFDCGAPHYRDVARRVTAPDYSKTALLVNVGGFDKNLRLYVVETPNGVASCGSGKALWVSHDFNPDTAINLHEDLQWSSDSSVVAVLAEGEYIYAYDFSATRALEVPSQINELLESRGEP